MELSNLKQSNKKSFFNSIKHNRENSNDKVLNVKERLDEDEDNKVKKMRKIIINDNQETAYSTNIIVTAKYNM
jgi:hypothetical protein